MESVNIATLKSKLSYYLRAVRKGKIINVLDRSTPIARIVPHEDDEEALPSRIPTRTLHSVLVSQISSSSVNSLEALLEERQNNR